LLDRRLDFHPPFEVSLELRHDVAGTDWAWGAAMRHTERTERFRVAEVTLEDNIATFGALFIEHKDVFGLTVQLRAANLFDGLSVLERTVYDGPRNVAPVLFTEDRRLPIGGVFNLNISGSF
ncbi:MAG: hypothetical protein GWN87_25535, partial [Desulfuromonadales bacterium]|nr:hypothetical protein [Desulfuromonadales bacterium]NIS43157.1 hypothetical protein [Desulfuromonadales bacterium]